MTYEEMIKLACKTKSRKKPSDEEHRIQCACVNWFRFKYPKLKNILFAVPNAARRSARNGAYMKEEGMLSGVADLILLKANRFYGALCVEMKTSSSRSKQSLSQKEWQRDAEANGAKYVVCRSLDEFIKVVTDYLNDV